MIKILLDGEVIGCCKVVNGISADFTEMAVNGKILRRTDIKENRKNRRIPRKRKPPTRPCVPDGSRKLRSHSRSGVSKSPAPHLPVSKEMLMIVELDYSSAAHEEANINLSSGFNMLYLHELSALILF
jgi:hypothetical protein